MSLVCQKCNMTDTEYGFEFFRGSKCRLILCVFCKIKEKKCPTCFEDIRGHHLKTDFARHYEIHLMQERRKLNNQIDCRKLIEKKWTQIKSQLNQKDYDRFLELIEQCVEAKYNGDDILISITNRKIEDLFEQNRNRQPEENLKDRPLPKQIPVVILDTKQPQKTREACGFKEDFYNMRKLLRYI